MVMKHFRTYFTVGALCMLVSGFSACQCGSGNAEAGIGSDSSDSGKTTTAVGPDSDIEKNSLYGCLHGEGRDRPENFDSISDVNIHNIRDLYALYNVTELEGGEYFIVESKKIYTNSKYLSRIIRMENGKQVAAFTFYDYSFAGMLESNGNLFFALNSLAFSGGYSQSSFCCKLVMMDKKFTPIKGNMIKSKDKHLDYCYISDLKTSANGGVTIDVKEIGFDSDYYIDRTIVVDSKNNILSDKRKKVIKS